MTEVPRWVSVVVWWCVLVGGTAATLALFLWLASLATAKLMRQLGVWGGFVTWCFQRRARLSAQKRWEESNRAYEASIAEEPKP